MKIYKSELKKIVEEVMNEGKPNDSVPSAMIYGRENVEVGFINGLKALEKVTAKMEKEGYGDRSLHQKLKKAFANVRKLGSQIGRTEGK